MSTKTDYDRLNRCFKDIGSSIYYGRSEPELDAILDCMSEEGVLPFEYIDWVYKVYPDMVHKNGLCSKKTWYAFLEYRSTRQAENRIKSDLQKKRLHYLLKQEDEDLEEVMRSNIESFFVFFRYIMACMLGDTEAKEEYKAAAMYELRTMPELLDLFKEFAGQHDLTQEVLENGFTL